MMKTSTTPKLTRSITLATRVACAAVMACLLFTGACNSSTDPSNTAITSTNPEGTNPPNLLTVTIKNGVFAPSPVNVTVGQSVNWLNADAIAHSATEDSGAFDTGSIPGGSAHDVPVMFNTVGTFHYHCSIHPSETATVIVTH